MTCLKTIHSPWKCQYFHKIITVVIEISVRSRKNKVLKNITLNGFACIEFSSNLKTGYLCYKTLYN